MLKLLNDITDSDLLEVKELASLFFSAEDIAEMLELEPVAFTAQCKVPGTKCYKAFAGGFYEGEIDVRKGIMKMAKAGSTPAQAMAMDLLKKAVIKRTH